MRKGLKARHGDRLSVVATFERWGTKPGYMGYPEKTLLLRDIRDAKTGERLADHLWFTCGVGWERLGLVEGMTVAFDARVSAYEKGYQGRRAVETGEGWQEIDYRLERPTRMRTVGTRQ